MNLIKINASELGKCRHEIIKTKLFPDQKLPGPTPDQIRMFAQGRKFEEEQIIRLKEQGLKLEKTSTKTKDQQAYRIPGSHCGLNYETRARADGIWFKKGLDCIWECKCVSKTVRENLLNERWDKVHWIGWQVAAMMWGMSEEFPRDSNTYPRSVLMTVGLRTDDKDEQDPQDFMLSGPPFSRQEVIDRLEFIVHGIATKTIPPCEDHSECKWHVIDTQQNLKKLRIKIES